MTVRIIEADVIDGLAQIEDGSVHCVMTSPPYWGLRDYGSEGRVWGGELAGCEHEWDAHWTGKVQVYNTDAGRKPLDPAISPRTCEARHQGDTCRLCGAWRGTLGLEPTPELYVEHLLAVFREVRRVLRDDGTLWLNLGDCYARNPGKGGSGPNGKHDYHDDYGKARRYLSETRGSFDGKVGRGDRAAVRNSGLTLKPKDLVGIPWRVAFALQADGWWLRSDIIWSKPNPMPESVRDRPTRAHEYVFLLAKRARYYYDASAIREPAIGLDRDQLPARLKRASENHKRQPTESKDGIRARRTDKQRGHGRRHAGFNDRWDLMTKAEQQAKGRNKRSVWEIATQPFKHRNGHHFATFPEALVKPCILAGSPEGGTILDPFAGTGTVGLVAQNAGRSAVLIDVSPAYCQMMRERLAQATLL